MVVYPCMSRNRRDMTLLSQQASTFRLCCATTISDVDGRPKQALMSSRNTRTSRPPGFLGTGSMPNVKTLYEGIVQTMYREPCQRATRLTASSFRHGSDRRNKQQKINSKPIRHCSFHRSQEFSCKISCSSFLRSDDSCKIRPQSHI